MNGRAACDFDAVVIGGGFFGLYLAEHLRRRYRDVLVCERQAGFMQRASYANQARVHNGYHYPRSILTAFRSRVNFPRFLAEFPACAKRDFTKLYAIGRRFSKVSAEQFRLFMARVGARTWPPTPAQAKLFDPHFIEQSFLVEECAFDADKLRAAMLDRVAAAGATLWLSAEVERLAPDADGRLAVSVASADGRRELRAGRVFNCTYSGINQVTARSGMPVIPLKHEMTEMALVDVPDVLRDVGITVMCGPFFSLMPFPALGLHTLSHVRYTPHFHWHDSQQPANPYEIFARTEKTSAYPHMLRDAQRYLPALAGCRYRDSLWEVKTVLPRSEVDDGRPILFKPHYGLPNHHVIMGGKIDNVYDMIEEIDRIS